MFEQYLLDQLTAGNKKCEKPIGNQAMLIYEQINHGASNPLEIMRLTGIGRGGVYAVLSDLVKRKMVRKVGAQKDTKYLPITK